MSHWSGTYLELVLIRTRHLAESPLRHLRLCGGLCAHDFTRASCCEKQTPNDALRAESPTIHAVLTSGARTSTRRTPSPGPPTLLDAYYAHPPSLCVWSPSPDAVIQPSHIQASLSRSLRFHQSVCASRIQRSAVTTLRPDTRNPFRPRANTPPRRPWRQGPPRRAGHQPAAAAAPSLPAPTSYLARYLQQMAQQRSRPPSAGDTYRAGLAAAADSWRWMISIRHCLSARPARQSASRLGHAPRRPRSRSGSAARG